MLPKVFVTQDAIVVGKRKTADATVNASEIISSTQNEKKNGQGLPT
jgi:hypothetical protein